MSDPTELLGVGASSAAIVWLGRQLWDQWVRRKEQLEERAEESEVKALEQLKAKLDQMQATLAKMESDARVAAEAARADAAVVREMKERIDGMSSNHGRRIGEIEQRLAVVEAKTGRRR